MFSRNKRSKNNSAITPPIEALPKEPVLRATPQLGGEDFMDAQQNVQEGGYPAVRGIDFFSSTSRSKTPDSQMSSKLEVVGNLKSTGALSLNGRVQGDIQATELELGPEAHVQGTVRAQRISVLGIVKGAIFANDVILKQSARVDGDIEHRSLSIESGAEFSGAVRRSDAPVEGLFDEPLEDKRGSKNTTAGPAIELQSSDKIDGGEKITSVLSAEEVAFNAGAANMSKKAATKPEPRADLLPGRKF